MRKLGNHCNTCGYFAMLEAEKTMKNSLKSLRRKIFLVEGATFTAVGGLWNQDLAVGNSNTNIDTSKCNGTYRYHRERRSKPIFKNENGAIMYPISSEAWGIRSTDEPQKEAFYFKAHAWNLEGTWSNNNPKAWFHFLQAIFGES